MSLNEHSNQVLPKWKSHKIVRAAPIVDVRNVSKGIVQSPDDMKYEIDLDVPGCNAIGICSVKAEGRLFVRYAPSPGDYYVVYEDGYVSISPKAAFEEGYSRA